MNSSLLLKADPDHSTNEDRFQRLKEIWKSETLFISSLTEITMHPAYQQIIGMGFAAVPLILKELAAAPNHWFWALTAITGENPASEVAQGRMDEMRDAWLKWGRRYGCSC